METVEIMHAKKCHKDFIIHANKVINNINDTNQTNGLEKNIDNDLFCEYPKFECLIAEYDNKPVGMILYSYFYWANDGQVLWISQMYIEEEYRKKGIFFKLLKFLRQESKDAKIVSCATGDENIKMQKILNGLGAHEINLKFYYIKK